MEKWEVYQDIKQLLKQGFSKTKVAEKLGVSRSTVYRYLKRNPQEMAEWMGSIETRTKKLDEHKELILFWLRKHSDMTAAQVYDWLLERYSDMDVAESTVRSYVKELREDYDIPKETSPRVYEAIPECPMGEQVQVDFGEIKVPKEAGGKVKLYFIAFVLSHSRYKYMYWLDRPFTTNDVVESHEKAFEWFEGIPNEIVYDQDSLIVVSENSGDLILTEQFQTYRELKELKLHVCRRADPESKGKIENVVGFIKYNFAKHREFHNLDSWNKQAVAWLDRTGNAKIHNTTKKRPAEVFTLEKQHLKPVHNIIDVPSIETSITRSVRKDNTIQYSSNKYSLPLGTFHQHKEVYLTINEDEQELNIYSIDGECLARHKISSEKGKLIQDRQHTRDRTKGIDQFIETVASNFDNKEQAYFLIEKIREEYPRYIRDQLQLLLSVSKDNPATVINEALSECIKRKLFGATDFSDVVDYVKRQRLNHETSTDNAEQLTQLETVTSDWVMETDAPTREVEQYYAIMGGDSK